MNTARIVALSTLATIALLAIGSTTAADGDAATSAVPPTTASGSNVLGPSPVPTAPGVAQSARVDHRKAAEIALGEVGGGHVTDVERERGYRGTWWEIEIRNSGIEHDVRVDGESGAITRHETDRWHDHDDDHEDDYDDDNDDDNEDDYDD
ncbi:MAG TPA: PepSY domain-containing protein [Pseudonocardia sp.]|nr:PepSY domain-containing protein [Pseudonocardia sp.]